MMPDICFLVLAYILHIRQNFGTHVITYRDFMVIVEPCTHVEKVFGKRIPLNTCIVCNMKK